MVKKGLLIFSLVAAFSIVFACQNTFADDNNNSINVTAGIDQVLKVEIPNDIAIRIKPGNRAPVFVTAYINVGTNNKTGLTAKMAMGRNRASESDTSATSLQHTTEDGYSIPTLTAPVQYKNFPAGYWGYSTTGPYETWLGMPALNDDNLVEVGSSNEPVNNIRFAFLLGVRVAESQPAGVYSGAIRVMATANPLPDEP